MTQTVELENGEIHEFPDEATPDQIKMALQGTPATQPQVQSQSKFNLIDPAEQLKQGGSPSALDLLQDAEANTLLGAAKLGELGTEGLEKIPGEKKLAGAIHNYFNLPNVNPEDTNAFLRQQESPVQYMGKNAVRGLSQTVPLSYFAGPEVLNQLMAGAASGASQGTPGSRTKSAMEGLLANSLAMGLPKILSGLTKGASSSINKISSKFMPDKEAENVIGELGQGAETLEQNNQSLAQDLKAKHDEHQEVVGDLMNPVLEKHGETLDIYPIKNPSGINAYREIPKFKLKGTDANSYYKVFSKDPNLNNANELQKQIGYEIGKIKKTPLSLRSPELKSQLKNLNSSYGKLNKQIESRIGEVDPGSLANWKAGRQYHKENVVPYRSDKTLESVVTGQETNPKNIHTSFEYPTNIINKKTGQEEIGPINKILSELPNESKNKILFSKIGGNYANKNAESLLKNLDKAKQAGFEKYFTPELENAIAKVSPKMKNLNKLKTAGKLSGIAGATGTAGALGGLLGSYLINKSHDKSNENPFDNTLG